VASIVRRYSVMKWAMMVSLLPIVSLSPPLTLGQPGRTLWDRIPTTATMTDRDRELVHLVQVDRHIAEAKNHIAPQKNLSNG
jgi:hypothetical protein